MSLEIILNNWNLPNARIVHTSVLAYICVCTGQRFLNFRLKKEEKKEQKIVPREREREGKWLVAWKIQQLRGKRATRAYTYSALKARTKTRAREIALCG